MTAAAALLPPNLRRLLAEGRRRRGSLRDIRHVVLLMQQGRSFDHYFGMFSGVRGFVDPDPLLLPTGLEVFYQPDAESRKGFQLPFHHARHSADARGLPPIDHGWAVQHRAWNGGRMDQWLSAHSATKGGEAAYAMAYLKRADIPFHYALAEAFTLCDGYHASVMGSAGSNRLHAISGTIDPEGRHGGPAHVESMPEEGFGWKTYPERLEEAGVSWKVYQHGSGSLGFNPLHAFRQFRDARKGSALQVKGVSACAEDAFEQDARQDRLPAVSWLCPPEEACERSGRDSAAGAAFIAAKLDAIAANPDLWARTAFILNYDGNGGLFDHVPPPVPPAGTPGEFVDGLPIGGGFRVPCILVSPWTAGGWVCSAPFDHSSVLRFLERFTGVREPNISAWRRRTFGDLSSGFRWT